MAKPANIITAADDAHLNGVFYSEPGVGKTRLMGTAAEVGPTLFLANNKDELVSLRKQKKKPDMWHCPDYNELYDAVEYVLHGGHKDYEFVILDNGTLMMQQGLDMIMEDLVAQKPHRDLFIPDKAEYLRNQNMFSKVVRDLVGAPVHFLMTAHVMTMDDPDDNEIFIPALPGTKGTYSQKICGLMNVVGYMRTRKKNGKTVRVMQTAKSQRVEAKDRFEVLPAMMVDPTIPQIMDLIGDAARPAKPTGTARKRRPAKARAKG